MQLPTPAAGGRNASRGAREPQEEPARAEALAGGPGSAFLAPLDTPHLLLERVARWLLVATTRNPPAYADRRIAHSKLPF